MKSCYFIGHRYAGELAEARVEAEIERHITEYGVTRFFVGHYGAFDWMAQKALVKAKIEHPDILALVVLPYLPAADHECALKGLDGTCYPEGQEKTPYRYAISALNREMIRRSDYLIAFVSYISAGSYKAMEYAQSRQRRGLLHITNLGALGGMEA